MAERVSMRRQRDALVAERNMLKRRLDELEARHDAMRAVHMGQLERAWHVIANAHRDGNGWLDAPPDWQEDAAQFRERIWLPALRARDGETGLCKVCGERPGCGELRGLCELCHRAGRVSFVLAGGDFTGKDEHAFAEAIKFAAAQVADAARNDLARARRREVVARGWLAVQGVASFIGIVHALVIELRDLGRKARA